MDPDDGPGARPVDGSLHSGRAGQVGRAARRVRPTRVAPVTILLREDAEWLIPVERPGDRVEALSHLAREVLDQLRTKGASFMRELVRATDRLPSEVEDGLWELAAAGLVTADGFDSLRALIDPKRRRGTGRHRAARPRHTAGRWALLRPAGESGTATGSDQNGESGVEPFTPTAAAAMGRRLP